VLELPVLDRVEDVARLKRAHCDVVVGLYPGAGTMDVVGGNVYDTVARSTVPLSRDGHAVRILERPWFFIVRAR
jgi:hypothetical protein